MYIVPLIATNKRQKKQPERFTIKFTSIERDKIYAAAQEEHLSPSSYLRSIVGKELDKREDVKTNQARGCEVEV